MGVGEGPQATLRLHSSSPSALASLLQPGLLLDWASTIQLDWSLVKLLIYGGMKNDHFDHNRIGCPVSLGTGYPTVARLETGRLQNEILSRVGIPAGAIEVMQSIITNTEPLANQLRDHLSDDVYFRFNVEQGLQAVELFDLGRSGDCQG